MLYQHTPVMLKEVLELFDPRPGQNFIDCTLGGGGYTLAIAKRILPSGKILAIDLDEAAIKNAQFSIFNPPAGGQFLNIILAHENFKNLPTIVKKYFTADVPSTSSGNFKFAGIVFDLGLSRAQLQDRSRGFSFNLAQAPLSMNFGQEIKETAENIINNRSVADLAKIFRDYGEEKFAYKIALAIVSERQLKKINSVGRLVEIIVRAIPKRFQQAKIHPATKIFQALRITVNSELENLKMALPPALDLLKPGGRLIVISYHSLEDRIVKQYFKQESRGCLCPPAMPICQCRHQAQIKILTHPLRPTEEEVLTNPRSRSAKLRAVEKI